VKPPDLHLSLVRVSLPR